MSEYIIEMKHITKRFPGIVANDDVTLQIKKGEIFALLGENGAGKSTLMSMIFGMYEPDEGEIFIRGKKEQIHSPSYATKLNIGMVHQHFKLVQNYTITENIILGLKKKDKLFGILPYVDLKKADQEIEALSKKYGLEVNPTDVIENTSVSTQQRVEILKMLYREAEILIFDEPTDHLDMESITALNNGMIKFPGVILFACRDHQVVQTTANRIIEFLPDGSMVDKVSTYDEYLESDVMARKRQVYNTTADEEADD